MGVHMGAPMGHPLQHVKNDNNPSGYFGQNYRDLGHFVRVTFMDNFICIRGRTMCSHRPHFVGLNGHPIGHPYGYPFGHPFLGSTSLNYCPFGAGMYECGVPHVGGRHAGTHIPRFHFVISFLCGLLRAL